MWDYVLIGLQYIFPDNPFNINFDASNYNKEVYTVSVLKNMRDFVSGRIDEAALQAALNESDSSIESDYDFENDPEFMQECASACMASIIQDMLIDESALEDLDEDTKEAFLRVKDYLVENGVMTEATVSLNNPKISVIKLSKQARKKRLTSIIALKMARKENSNDYRKYKVSAKLKKTYFGKILGKYQSKAERLANKLIQQAKRGKVASVVEAKKAERAKKHK